MANCEVGEHDRANIIVVELIVSSERALYPLCRKRRLVYQEVEVVRDFLVAGHDT